MGGAVGHEVTHSSTAVAPPGFPAGGSPRRGFGGGFGEGLAGGARGRGFGFCAGGSGWAGAAGVGPGGSLRLKGFRGPKSVASGWGKSLPGFPRLAHTPPFTLLTPYETPLSPPQRPDPSLTLVGVGLRPHMARDLCACTVLCVYSHFFFE